MVYALFLNQAIFDCPHSSALKKIALFPNFFIYRLCSLNLLIRLLKPHVRLPMASPHQPLQRGDLAAHNNLPASPNRFRAASVLLHSGPFMVFHLSDHLYYFSELRLHIPNSPPYSVPETQAQIQNLAAQARNQKKKVEAG